MQPEPSQDDTGRWQEADPEGAKRHYEPPAIVELGSFAELTRGGTGTTFDAFEALS